MSGFINKFVVVLAISLYLPTLGWTNESVKKSMEMLHNSLPDKNGNYLVSEYSASIVLDMLRDAADGATKQEIDGWFTNRKDNLYQFSDGVLVKRANIVLLRNDNEAVSMLDSYSTILTNRYKAEKFIFKASEADKVALQGNNLISDKTNGMIKDFLDAKDLGKEDYIASIVNVLYFNGTWTDKMTPFDGFIFNTSENEKIQVEGLNDHKAKYVFNETLQGFKKKYIDRENRYSFYAFLPKDESVDINLMGLDLNPESFKSKYCRLIVNVPKFEYETDYKLEGVLKKFGIKNIFEKRTANLSRGFSCKPSNNVYISDVRQKNRIRLDEDGTVAAAVTKADVNFLTLSPAPPKEKIILNFNRPFVFMIYDEKSEQALFMGIVNKPTDVEYKVKRYRNGRPIAPQRPLSKPHVWKNHMPEKCSECIRYKDDLAKYFAKHKKYLIALGKWNFENSLDVDEKIFYERISGMSLGMNSTKYDKRVELKILKKLAELFAEEYRIVSVDKKSKIVVFEKMQDEFWMK